MKELEQLAEEQEKLSEESKENNTKEAQEKLNEKFEDFQKQMDELDLENQKLKKPMDLPQDKPTEESIKQDQKEATEAFYNQMMNLWRDNQPIVFPENHEEITRPLTLSLQRPPWHQKQEITINLAPV